MILFVPSGYIAVEQCLSSCLNQPRSSLHTLMTPRGLSRFSFYIIGQKKKALYYLKKTKKQADGLEDKSVFYDDVETLYEDCKLLIYRY